MEKNGETIHILDTEVITDMATQNALLDMQQRLDAGFDLSYEIMANACACISDIELEKLPHADFYETETASVYTGVQLSWLNINNQADIAEIVKEYDSDIGTACAVWYNQKVAEACTMLVNYISQAND